jgi:UDP-N-acetylglucosamine 4,6-dehydratase
MSKILITGGTGSLGKVLTHRFEQNNTIIVYSRDEGKQALLPNHLIKVIGDVRDYEKLKETIIRYEPDEIIHTAALKRVDDMEMYPDECVKTNIIGSQNLVNASLYGTVKKCLLISTDKACQPINVYGASKFVAERTFINADHRSKYTKFSICRYGNVIASRGSFIPLWLNKINNDEVIDITDTACTRFLFSLDRAVNFVERSLKRMLGGEVFVPTLNSYKITKVVKALERITNKKAIINISGLRPGEKIHEDMLNIHEMDRTYMKDQDLQILPQYSNKSYGKLEKYYGKPLNSELHTDDNINYLINLIQFTL